MLKYVLSMNIQVFLDDLKTAWIYTRLNFIFHFMLVNLHEGNLCFKLMLDPELSLYP